MSSDSYVCDFVSHENFMSGSMRAAGNGSFARALAAYAPVGDRRGMLVSP
jgi:hypothetical protein